MATVLMAMLFVPTSGQFMTSGYSVLRGVDDYQAAAGQLQFPVSDESKLNLTGHFIVPPKPASWDGQTQVYLWFGVNWYDSKGICMGVMQPVLTYGCSPNAMSGVGCGTNTSDPNYSADPYWYFSSQYVLGWGPGQAFGSDEVIKTLPGSRIYSEMSYNSVQEAWVVIGRDESTGQTSTFWIHYPMQNSALSWHSVHADAGTQATLYAVSEPHQVSNAATQMPAVHDFEFSVVGPTSDLIWSGGQGSAKVVQQGGPECADDKSVSQQSCESFAAQAQCTNDLTWCHLCAATCGAHGASCGCVVHNPPLWKPTLVTMDLSWEGSGLVV